MQKAVVVTSIFVVLIIAAVSSVKVQRLTSELLDAARDNLKQSVELERLQEENQQLLLDRANLGMTQGELGKIKLENEQLIKQLSEAQASIKALSGENEALNKEALKIRQTQEEMKEELETRKSRIEELEKALENFRESLTQ